KQVALNDFMNQRADPVIAGGGALDDFFDFRAIGKTDGSASGVNDELLGEIPGELLLLGEKQRLEIANVMEFTAIGEFAAGVHGQRIVKGEFLPAFGDAVREIASGFGAVAIAPAAHDIKI